LKGLTDTWDELVRSTDAVRGKQEIVGSGQ
jgi:hypothetical protein